MSDVDLRGFGYAGGDYTAKCNNPDCESTDGFRAGQKGTFIGDKRACRCRPCAMKAHEEYHMAKTNLTAKERVQQSVRKVAEALENLTKAFENVDETLKSDAASKTFAFVSSMVSESHQRAALSFNVSKARSGQFDLDDDTLAPSTQIPVIAPIGTAPVHAPNIVTLPYVVPPHIVLGEDGRPEGRLAGSKVEKVSAALRKVDPEADFLED